VILNSENGFFLPQIALGRRLSLLASSFKDVATYNADVIQFDQLRISKSRSDDKIDANWIPS
jgi:hypothetical protein